MKYLTYGSSGEDFVLPYAVRQLRAITSKCTLTEVTFDISIDSSKGPLDADVCAISVWNIKDKDEFQSSFEGVGILLDYCRSSIVDLKLYLVRVENISDLGVLTRIP